MSLPKSIYVFHPTFHDKLVPVASVINERTRFPALGTCRKDLDSPLERGIPVGGSTNDLYIAFLDSGDFVVGTSSHHLYGANSKPIQLQDVGEEIVLASLPRPRCWRSLFSKATRWGEFLSRIWRGDMISISDIPIHKCLLRAYISRKRFELSFVQAQLLRSVCNAFGYNVIYVEDVKDDLFVRKGIFMLSRSRPKKDPIVRCRRAHVRQPVFDVFMQNATQTYAIGGILHQRVEQL